MVRRIYFQTTVFMSEAKNFIKNVFWYKDILIHDRPWDNDFMLEGTQRKLEKTIKHYESGLYLPYEGWEDDLVQIKRAYHLSKVIYENDNLLIQQTYTPQEMNEMVDEYFNILKNYRKWWD